jgi:hypothetical protein
LCVVDEKQTCWIANLIFISIRAMFSQRKMIHTYVIKVAQLRSQFFIQKHKKIRLSD